MDFGHVSTHHYVWQAARAGESVDVFLCRLRRAAKTRWQIAVEELITRPPGDFEQLFDLEPFQSGARFADAFEVLADDAGVNLAYLCFDLAGSEVLNLGRFQAFVEFPASQSGDMWNIVHV